MQFNFNFEAFEQSGKEKNEAINYLKSLNSSIDFDKLEQETKGDENAIYEALKGGNFSFSKPSIEQTRQKLLKNKENEALKAEFNAGLSWLGEEKKQNFNFYDFKKAKEKANSKQGLIQADLKEKEKQMQKKEALFETRLKERGIIAKSFDDMLDQSGAYLGADLLEKGLNKLGFKDENYIFESEKEDIKSRALKSVREKLERGDLEFNEREKHALRSKYDELDYKKALEKEKERLRLSQKSGNFSEAEREFIENDLGFFNTLFNDDKENIKEFKEKVKSEGVISSEIIKAANTLKAFDEGNLFKNMLFADEKEKKEFQQNFLNDAYKIAELSGFDDVGLDKKGELYFIKDEQKYLVNTGFFDNFAQLLNDTKFEFAGGVLGGLKGFNSGKSAKGKVAKSILGAAAGSFGGAFLDAKIADMYLNRESDFKKNLDFALQAGLLSMAGDGVILSVKPLAKGLYKGVKKGGEILGEYSILGTLKTLPEQNIQAAEKIINEVFSPKMKEELKAAQEEFGGSVRGEDLKNAFFANLQKKFTQKYGENDSKTKSVAKIAEIFNTNSLKTRQQAMLDLVRSDKDGSTLAYLLEIAKDDVKIQSNLKNMLNLASSNVEKNLKNLNINAREIKHILDEFEAGNKAAFKEVESQIARLYDENYRVVLSKGEYENIKEEFRQNGVNLEEMTPFLRDLEANVFNENGVTFTQLNNFRKNLNFYIFNKDKTPNFINTLKKIGENILKNEIDKGIDNIFSQNKAAYESIKELYSTSLKDYATLKSLNESIKNLKLQDSAKSADEVLNSLIKYAKGQGEKGVNNLQKIKDYLGEENNAFLEMQILNKLFKESVVENDRASLRVFDSESFLGRVRELVGENELYERKIGKEFLEELSPSAMPKQISIDEFLNTLENFKNKENFLKHIEKDPKRKDYLNLIEPTLKEPDIAFKKLENGVEKEKFIKKFSDGKDFFYLLATKDNKETILTAFKTDKINTILKEFNADIIPTFIRQGSKGKAAGTTNEGIITQPLFKSKEAREFLELVEGFHKLYKNDASIAKNLVQGTASQLSTSIATSAEGAIKQKVVKGGFDPIFRLLPDKILFGLFAKQIQGGALRYHLKKALSRSLNYDDFKIKLEKELKRTNFNSNTSRLIDEFMQNLEDFNREKEQFLEAKRIEQTRIKEEERKRAEEIYKRQEEIYQAQEANNLKDILEAEEKPLKDEFGVNFEGFKGKEAIEKLLEEQRGQVKGAFYKEGLGEIDLVWGDENFGLRHILEQRTKQWGEEKALKFISHLNENIEKGQIVEVQKGRAAIKTDLTTIILDKKENNNFVLTAFRDRNNKKELESLNLSQSKTFTSENAEANAKESPVTSLNQESIIPQNAKNDEVLEAEVIEEVGLNEPMKFLEFQQRKLLTYIKENTPLRLLEHKKELKTRDILNFLEQSALNGKQKVFLMRNLERDLGKLEAQLKEAEEVGFKEAKNAVDDDFLKGYDEKIKQNIKSLEFENELIENPRPRGREPQDRYISLAYFMANFAQHYKLLDLKNPRTKEQIKLLENALKKQNIGYEVLENEPVAIRYFKKEWVNSQEAKIKEAVKNHNAIYKEILDNDYRFTDERSKIFRKRERELIENLAKDEKVQAFTSQWGYPFKKDGELRGIGLNYKAKVYGKGEHKMMYVDGGGFGSKAFQKKKERLLELEKERLQEAFKADFGIDGFISKYVENDFFETLWGETKAYKGTDYGWGVHPREYYPYYENRIMPSDTITQAKEKLQKEKSSWSVKRQEAKGSEDIIFTDKKGKEHTLTKETQKAWLEAFGLKSLEEAYIPNLPRELKEALGKEIKLTKGSLYKIVEKGREKYIPQMKQTLQNPDFALRDRDNMLILAKQIEDKQYFTSVNLETKDYFISVSNAPKKENILKNKVENGAEILYQSPNAKSIFYTDTLLQTDKSSANKIDEDIIAQNAKSERAEFESFKDKIKELYTKYEGLSPYDKSESQLRIKLLDEEIEPEIKKEFKNIIDKFKGADNKDKILRVIKENKEELSDYLAFHIALRKDIDIDGHGEGKVDFYDKSIRDFIKFRENKRWSEIDESKYRALAALENLSNKNTSLYFSFRDLNGKVGEFKTYPRIQDLLFYDLILGYDLKNAVILSTKDKLLKEKLIEKLKAYIDKKIYADFLEYKIKDLESRNPKNSHFENYKDEKWDEEALKSLQKELEDLRANEKAQKLEAKGSEDIIFTDKKGKEHTLTKETQKAWLEAFGLKSLEEAYIPNFKAEVKEAINRVLGGEEIKLTKGSFEKLLKEKRLKYLDRIKPTLENPHSVILQNDGALIFARDYGEEKYFTSVARNDSGEWIIRSNAPKSKNGLNNKILNGGKEIYNDQAASQINASNPYDDIANSNIKLDNESIAQNSHYLELVKEYGEENAKSIIKQKILGENIAQVLENEEEKFIYKKGDREFEFKIKDAMGQFEMQYDELNLKSDLNKSFLKALNKLKIGYEVLENEPVRIRYFKQEAKERKPKETKPSADKTLGQIQKDMSARLKELKAQAKENYERYKNEDKALQKELTNTKDLFKAFEKEFNETEGTILISRAKRRKNDAEGKVETSVFLGNELALRNALDRWERYSGYSEENALEVKERLELLRSYVKRLEKHREDIKAKREQLEQDYQQNEAARSKEMGVIGNYNILSNLKGVSENELYEPFLEKVGGYLSKADFYERHLPFAREEFQKLFNLTPLKEFGTNYAEFYRDGKGAVEKLLKEAEDFKQRGEKGEFKGQVSGAFYKEGLGEIDLVWGDENFGLRHIIDKHGDEFEDIAAELDEIIAKGVLEKGEHRYFIKHNDYKGMIALDYKGKESNAWILTLYKDKSALNPAYQHQIKHNTNTSSETRANGEFENSNIKNANLQKEKVDKLFHGDAEVISAQGKFNELEALNLTDEDIIPQQKIKFAMEKFHFDEAKAKDLLEWHKNSHALTKDENGLPKVFYHGTYSKFRVFRRVGKASQQGFFFTPSQKATEEYGDITLNTFLNIKNPFRADELKINKEADLQKWADILKLDYDKEKYESFKDLKTKLEKVKEATKKAGFKFHSASGGGVYVIDNKGRNSFINLEELDKENKRVVEAFKGLETEDIYFYYVVRNEFDLVLYALNKNDRYFHTSGRDEVKRVLEKLGYDGVVLNDTIITVFNSNQIKHIDNKGSFTDTKGNVTSKKPKDKEVEFSYFNEK
ncbi:PBECR2 nuclease fold domain-containing protein, partial [Campylobacter upsaliensis]